MTLEPFEPRHLWEIELQPSQAESWRRYGSLQYAQGLTKGLSYSLRIEGRLIGCFGIAEPMPAVGHLWSFVARDTRPYFVRLHRTALRLFEVSGKRTIIATSECTFLNGCRWLQMLGFRRAELLPGYGIDGADHMLYVKEL